MLLAVDSAVKGAVAQRQLLLDLQVVSDGLPEALKMGAAKALAVSVASSKRVNKTHDSSTYHEHYGQVKPKLRELASNFSAALQEQALQVAALQKVLLKKQDPASHMLFVDILGELIGNRTTAVPSDDKHSHLLSRGRLMTLFWSRLSLLLADLTLDKLRKHPIAAVYAYPFLRRQGLRTISDLQVRAHFSRLLPISVTDRSYDREAHPMLVITRMRHSAPTGGCPSPTRTPSPRWASGAAAALASTASQPQASRHSVKVPTAKTLASGSSSSVG